MSYIPYKRLFDPQSKEPFAVSRTKIELFLRCKRCFYLDRRLGISKPSIPTFLLNLAVDNLFKNEFDYYRKKKQPHPLFKDLGLIPYDHKDLGIWRENFKGVRVTHKESNFIVFGAIDDVLIDNKNFLYVVDYKSTSKDNKEDVGIDTKWGTVYKNQMEIYQWLFKKKGFDVSDQGYFVYANGQKNEDMFNNELKFDSFLVPYKGDSKWVDDVLIKMRELLENDQIPDKADDCEYCSYRENAGKKLLDIKLNKK